MCELQSRPFTTWAEGFGPHWRGDGVNPLLSWSQHGESSSVTCLRQLSRSVPAGSQSQAGAARQCSRVVPHSINNVDLDCSFSRAYGGGPIGALDLNVVHI